MRSFFGSRLLSKLASQTDFIAAKIGLGDQVWKKIAKISLLDRFWCERPPTILSEELLAIHLYKA